jgi:hypothetical protein
VGQSESGIGEPLRALQLLSDSWFTADYASDGHRDYGPPLEFGRTGWMGGEMTEEEQRPDYQELHFSLLEAIKKYEAATNWSVVALKLTAKKGVSELEVTVSPNPRSPR